MDYYYTFLYFAVLVYALWDNLFGVTQCEKDFYKDVPNEKRPRRYKK